MGLTKRCCGCNEEKSLDEFSNSKDGRYGKQRICRKCRKEAGKRDWQAVKADEEAHRQVLEYRKQYRKQNKETLSQYNRQFAARRYGFTLVDYGPLFEAQGGVCAICGKPETRKMAGSVMSLSMDHDHITKKVRALLCHDCNVGLGYFHDDVELLRKAADYLEHHKEEARLNGNLPDLHS